MSVIIRLQNLPWSANALDIRNYFRGLSIPEGGVHIVGGELGDAFIAFSTDEDARQAMMLDGGKIKEIQVKLLLSSRSEMHKVIESARQTVPLLTLNASAAAPAPAVVAPAPTATVITPFSAALGTSLSTFGIPGIGNPQEIPQPAVIEPPAPIISPTAKSPIQEEKEDDIKSDRKRSKEKDRRRTRSRSRSRERKDRKRDRRDRSRSRERRRRDRSRSRERRDRKRDRKDRSRSRDRSPSRRSRDKRNGDRKSPMNSMERSLDNSLDNSIAPGFSNMMNSNGPQMPLMLSNPMIQNMPIGHTDPTQNRFNDPALAETFNKLQELGKKRNPNAFQGDQQNGSKFSGGRGGNNVSRGQFRREGRSTRFEDQQQRDCCVALRNAPNHTSYGDVRRFFPFMIDKRGIKMINDNLGRRTGNIFVRFCETRAKQLALQRKTNELKGSQVVVESLDDDTYDAATDSFLPFREDNDEEDTALVISDAGDASKSRFSVLKLDDLPNFVQEHDIMKAFSDFSLLSIQLVDCRHTRTKNAYVEFVKEDDAKLALKRKDTYVFGRRHPAITPLTDEEYKKEKSKENNSESSTNAQSVNNAIQEPAAPRDPRQRRQMDNGPSSQSGPQMQNAPQQPFFPNTPFSQNFRGPFPGPQFGGFPNLEPRNAQNWGNRMNFGKQSDTQTGPMGNQQAITLDIEDEPLDCVLMKGLPREATDRTIVNFLSDTGAVPSRIHLMLDGNGLPSGDCFCEFRSSQEARQAGTKHGSLLDGCRVTVDPVMRSVVEEALEGPKGDSSQGGISREGLLGPPPPFVNSPRLPFLPNRGQFRGRGFDRGGFDRGGFMNRGGFDPRGRGMMRGRGGWAERGRGFDPRGRGRGFMRAPAPPRDDEPDPALEDFGAPGCVLSMENVPFRATIDDILTFFGDFELTQDDVIRRYNERGQPTGDARVSFRSPFDAQRALSSRHLSSIYDRRITLTLM